jgi:hypothetical protein
MAYFSLEGLKKQVSERPHLEESQLEYTQTSNCEVDTWLVRSWAAGDHEFLERNSKREKQIKKPCFLIYADTPIGACFTTLTIKGCGYPVGILWVKLSNSVES